MKKTLYIDEETEKLLKENITDSYSQIFKIGLKKHIEDNQTKNKALEGLPSEDEIEEQFKQLPSPRYINEIRKAYDKLPPEDEIKDSFKHLPTVEELEAIGEKMDELMVKAEQLKDAGVN